MKRAIAVLVLGLAACSSGGDGGPVAAVAPTTTIESTTTTESAATRKAGFLAHLSEQLEGEDDAFRTAAYDLAMSMCDLLDSTTTAAGAPDNAADVLPDAVMSGSLTRQALDTASATGLAPDVTAMVMRAGASDLCPQHTAVVAEYADQMT